MHKLLAFEEGGEEGIRIVVGDGGFIGDAGGGGVGEGAGSVVGVDVSFLVEGVGHRLVSVGVVGRAWCWRSVGWYVGFVGSQDRMNGERVWNEGRANVEI